jgi:hypothetical protein
MIGSENLLNKAVECKVYQDIIPLNSNSWSAGGLGKRTIIFPARIIILEDLESIYVRNIINGNISMTYLADLNFIPEIITEKEHYLVCSDGFRYHIDEQDFLHRTTGPAVESPNGKEDKFVLHGIVYSNGEEFLDSLSETDQTDMLWQLDKLNKNTDGA